MNKQFLFLFAFSFLSFIFIKPLAAQSKFTLSGYIKDTVNGETLFGATIYISELQKGTGTNEFGFYSITVPQGQYTVKYSYVGYGSRVLSLDMTADRRMNLALGTNVVEAKEVVVTSEKGRKVESTEMGREEVTVEQAKAVPSFLGEVNILKVLQTLPGVQGAGEGNSGFYVRGGGPDQNLVLLDGATVYNTDHLFGFFSVFNSDAIKSTTIVKGGMPANFGGRISSVVEVGMKEGDMKKYEVEGGIGFVSSRITVQGPIKKDKCSFIISARRTFLDLLLAPLFKGSQNGALSGDSYYFYDLNAKFNYKFSDKDRVYFSGYFGQDVFNFAAPGGNFKFGFPYGNATASSRWNHLFNSKLFMNTMLLYNQFAFQINSRFLDNNFHINSNVREATAKIDFDYSPFIGHLMKFGIQYNYHIFTPYQTDGTAGSTSFKTTNTQPKFAHETALYFLDDFEVNRWLKINAGLRVSMFNFVGPFKKIEFSPQGTAIDTLVYGRNQNIKTYYGAEPRLSARFKVDKASSIKLGITVNEQYVHLVSSANTTLPVDLWVPSTKAIKPQIGIQYALGYFRNFKDDMIETSVEVYYKDMRNQIEYGESAVGGLNQDIEDQFVYGKGWSYGAEFFVKKAVGKWTGWIGYTLAWTWRKFPDINNGLAFPAKYDRRHDLNIVFMYDITKRWKASATFVYATGNTTTLPVSAYYIEGVINFNYGARNGYRIEPYHRMDLSVTYTLKERKHLHSELNLSIYNVYSHLNPFFIYIDQSGKLSNGNAQLVAKKVSLFPILPSITWNFKI